VATASSPSHEHQHIHPQSENKPWWWEMLCVYSHRDIYYISSCMDSKQGSYFI
jgi:hypothetical protein